MSDNKKHNEDEYQFPGDEYLGHDDAHHQQNDSTDAEQAAADSKQSASQKTHLPDDDYDPSKIEMIMDKLSMLKNKRVVIVIVVAVVALVLFKFITPNRTDKTAATTSKRSQLSAQLQQAQSMANKNAQTNSQVNGKLNALHSNEARDAAAINDVQNKVTQLQSSLNAVNSEDSQLQTQMTDINQKLNKLVNALKSKHVTKSTAKKVVPVIHYHYVTKAVVPGRAWIVDQFGQSRNVALGDVIKQYGRVKFIDANTGAIMTSSGKVINYGQNDY